jgi:hypothetical protein
MGAQPSIQTTTEEYWIGPYDVRISKDIERVPREDDRNMIYQNGRMTKMMPQEPIGKENYLARYAESREDGFYYFKKECAS